MLVGLKLCSSDYKKSYIYKNLYLFGKYIVLLLVSAKLVTISKYCRFYKGS